MKQKHNKKKDIGPLKVVRGTPPASGHSTEKRADHSVTWAEFNPCNSCPDADKHCYECAHQHRRLDGNGWTIPSIEAEEWAIS